MNLFHVAICENDLPLLMKQLQSYALNQMPQDEIDAFDENRTRATPLQLALLLGRFDMAVLLLVYGANPNKRAEDTHHIFDQIMQQRDGGDLLASLLFMAPGMDAHVREHFLRQIKFNSSVFHVLFYTALTLGKDTFASRLLTETLPSLPADIQAQLIGNLTGALYFCIKRDYSGVKGKLVDLKVPPEDSKLPPLGAAILPGIEFPVETKLSFAQAVDTNNYLEIDKSKNSEVDLPFSGAHLPWLLLKRKDVYSHVNSLIQDEKWNELKTFEAVGFSVPQHLYMLIKDPRRIETMFLIRKLKNYPSLAHNFNDQLEKQFLFVICDHFLVNESVLNLIFSLRSMEEKHEEVKHEDVVKSKLLILEAKLIQLRASAVALQKFRVIKNEILAPPAANSIKNKLMEQPIIFLWKIPSYLTQSETYTLFAHLCKKTRNLALQDRLPNRPSAWQRFNTLSNKEKEIDEVIAELVPYKQSLCAYVKKAGHENCLCCLSDLSLAATLTFDLSCGVFNYGCGTVFSSCLASGAPGTCAFHSLCWNVPLAGWLWGHIGIPLAAGCGLGIVGNYYCCDKNIPGPNITVLNQAGQQVVNRAMTYLPAGTERPESTTGLIQALRNAKQQIQNAKILYKLKVKETMEAKMAEAAANATGNVVTTESKADAEDESNNWANLDGSAAAASVNNSARNRSAAAMVSVNSDNALRNVVSAESKDEYNDEDESAAASLRRPLLHFA